MNRTRLIRLVGVIGLMVLLLGAQRAAAQQTLTIQTLLIQLWPEYDQPSMLVQYTGQMNETDEVSLTFTLPESASLHVTAYVDAASGGLIEIPDPQVDGSRVTITSPNGSFHVEFYDDLAKSGTRRDYAITWAGDYAVTSLQWDLQMPPDASDVETTPQTSGPVQQSAMDHYIAFDTGLTQGETASLEITYQKSSDVLAVDAEPAEPLSDAETTEAGDNPILIAALVIVLVAAIGAGAYAYVRSGKNQKQQRTSADVKHPSSKPRTKNKKAATAESGRFCTKCGTSAQDSDKFCRKCGAALR